MTQQIESERPFRSINIHPWVNIDRLLIFIQEPGHCELLDDAQIQTYFKANVFYNHFNFKCKLKISFVPPHPYVVTPGP